MYEELGFQPALRSVMMPLMLSVSDGANSKQVLLYFLAHAVLLDCSVGLPYETDTGEIGEVKQYEGKRRHFEFMIFVL